MTMNMDSGALESSHPISGAEISELVFAGKHLIQAIFSRCSLREIETLIDDGAPLWYQLEENGMSALHAACHVQNHEIVQYLIAKGAIWNLVDNLQNTAADIALSLNDTASYTMIRDAGLRLGRILCILPLSKSTESDRAASCFAGKAKQRPTHISWYFAAA